MLAFEKKRKPMITQKTTESKPISKRTWKMPTTDTKEAKNFIMGVVGRYKECSDEFFKRTNYDTKFSKLVDAQNIPDNLQDDLTQILFSGDVLENASWVQALVLYCGEEWVKYPHFVFRKQVEAFGKSGKRKYDSGIRDIMRWQEKYDYLKAKGEQIHRDAEERQRSLEEKRAIFSKLVDSIYGTYCQKEKDLLMQIETKHPLIKNSDGKLLMSERAVMAYRSQEFVEAICAKYGIEHPAKSAGLDFRGLRG